MSQRAIGAKETKGELIVRGAPKKLGHTVGTSRKLRHRLENVLRAIFV